MTKQIPRLLLLVAVFAVLSTVFTTDNFLWQGVVTAKYFWFAAVMCMVSFLILFQFSGKHEIHITDLLFGVLAVYISINYFFRDTHPGMHWWLTLLMIPLYVAVRAVTGNEKSRRWLLDTILVVVLVEAAWGLLQLYGFAHSYHSLYKITGTFFNPGPYSGFVAVGVPLALGYSLDKTLPRWERWLGIVTLAATVLVLPAAMSRAAWIAAIAGSGLMVIQSLKFKVQSLKFKVQSSKFKVQSSKFNIQGWQRVVLMAVVGILVVGMLAGVYFLKKDSADGRWVIWRASMEAVKEHPFLGAGYGRFAAVYGDAQATYFLDQERTAAQVMVADSPEYAFNEYVQMAVELGMVGLVLFLLTVGSSLINFKLQPSAHRRQTSNFKLQTINFSLVTFLVFSAFSYPFSVLPLGILFVFLLALLAPSSRKLSFTLPSWLWVVGVVACWGITAYSAYQIFPKRTAYREWPSLQMLYNANAYKQAVKEYETWYPKLRHEKQFLFEYGQCLSKTGRYAESNQIFEQYLYYGSDPMIYNCMGNNFKEMGDYVKAENAYIRASQIVPNRHYPLYLLMKLYQESGQTTKAKAMAEALLKKPVKVPSTAIREMQEEAKELR